MKFNFGFFKSLAVGALLATSVFADTELTVYTAVERLKIFLDMLLNLTKVIQILKLTGLEILQGLLRQSYWLKKTIHKRMLSGV